MTSTTEDGITATLAARLIAMSGGKSGEMSIKLKDGQNSGGGVSLKSPVQAA
jgi:hypothetical protein